MVMMQTSLESDSATTTDGDSVTYGAPPIGTWRLLLSTLGPVCLLLLSAYYKVDLEKKILLGLVRSTIQLLFLGHVLLHVIFTMTSLPLILLYLLAMIAIAALESIGRQGRTYHGHYRDAFLACFFSGGGVGLYASIIVFHPNPWWKPEVLIPTSGMLIGNTVSGPAVAIERLLADVLDKKHETEVRLCWGATAYEAVLPMARSAARAALLPQLNQLAIIGLVSIPGMMTGQLLGGTSPSVAAEYQLAIFFLLVATNVISTLSSIILALRHGVFDTKTHRLTPEKIIKREGGKMEIDRALWSMLTQGCDKVKSFCLGHHEAQGVDGSEAAGSAAGRGAYSQLDSVEMSPLNGTEGGGRTGYQIENTRPYEILEEAVDLQLHLEQVNVLSGGATLFGSDGLSLTIRPGEILTLEGPSGLGKTRLLRAISQLDELYTGSLCYGSSPWFHAPSILAAMQANNQSNAMPTQWTVPKWRCRVIYVPQVSPRTCSNQVPISSRCLTRWLLFIGPSTVGWISEGSDQNSLSV